MLMTNFLKNRRSTRDFRRKTIDEDTLIELCKLSSKEDVESRLI